MRMAFYIGRKGTLLDKIIDIWSGCYGYSHCELIFRDGMSFSASPREGVVRFKKIDYDPDKWVFKDLLIDIDTEINIRRECKKYISKKYDYLGVFLYYIAFTNIEIKNMWWCSEICGKVIGMVDYEITPNQLAKRMGINRQLLRRWLWDD